MLAIPHITFTAGQANSGIRARKPVLAVFEFLILACLVALGCSSATETPQVGVDKEAETDFIAKDPLFIEDLNVLESSMVTVVQPTGVISNEKGMGEITEGASCISSDLDIKSRASAYRLLRDLVADYPLQRSFRSIQEDWLIAPEYSISYSRAEQGKREYVFRIDMYSSLTRHPVIEIKHERGGRVVWLDKNIAPTVYSFFAQSIAPRHPETARALDKIAKEFGGSTQKEAVKGSAKAPVKAGGE